MKRFLINKYAWLFLSALLIGGLALTRTSQKAQGLNMGAVVRGDLIQRVTISGVVKPNRRTLISPPYNGYIKKMFVEVGQQLKAGDPVVSIAQSLGGNAEEVYPLRAPFAGMVVQVLKTEGEYVEQQGSQGGNALVRIDDLTRLFVEASTPEIEVDKLKLGQEAVIKASAVLGRAYTGKIRHISLAAKDQNDWDKSRVEFPVVIEVTNSDLQLKSGMSVVVDIITNKLTNILTLKHEFLQKDGDKFFVVTENGEKKPIEVGTQNEEVFEVRGGVKEGEKIRQTDFLSIIKDEKVL
ncbi:efflux RND transporter periplasmic adaptor subunit [Bdellovibrionota bacterium FG-1]